jgi:hypothetical protein
MVRVTPKAWLPASPSLGLGDGGRSIGGGNGSGNMIQAIPFHASVIPTFHQPTSNRSMWLVGLRNFLALTNCCSAVEKWQHFKHSSAQDR